eukprot:14738101-Ditylum_brightwellii.AAC.1
MHLMLHTELNCLRARATEVKQMNKVVEKLADLDFETVCQLFENYLLEIDCRDRTLKVKELTDMV